METQANSNIATTISGNTIVNAGTSNSNSALAIRAGTDNGEGDANGTINTTFTDNIKNAASPGTGGGSKPRIALGSGVSVGNICLDYNNNTLKNRRRNDPAAEFNLVHASTGDVHARRNGGGNVGVEQHTGRSAATVAARSRASLDATLIRSCDPSFSANGGQDV